MYGVPAVGIPRDAGPQHPRDLQHVLRGGWGAVRSPADRMLVGATPLLAPPNPLPSPCLLILQRGAR